MGLEAATFISGLNANNPVNASDTVNEGDDHIRLIKSTMLNTFPNITGAMNASHTELNNLVGVTGKTGTGNLVLSASPTITGTLTAAAITFSGALTGSGAALTALNASNLASGTVPNARFPATLPAASGANLTALNASNLGSGTVPDARFPATLPALNGSALTNLNGSNISSGTINNSRLDQSMSLTASISTPLGSFATVETDDIEIFETWKLTGIISPSSLSGGGSSNNYAPTGHATASVFRLTSAGAHSITGLAGGVDGRRVLLLNIGSNPITILNENASSTAANRFAAPGAGGGGETIGAGRGIEIIYDGTSNRWRAIVSWT